jgi:hypothetical protein
MLLMTSGRVVYCGKTADVLPFVKPYFRPWEAWENPMDYILEFLCQLQPEQAEQVRCLPIPRCIHFQLAVQTLHLTRRKRPFPGRKCFIVDALITEVLCTQFNKLNNMKAPTRGTLPVVEKLRCITFPYRLPPREKGRHNELTRPHSAAQVGGGGPG